MASFLYFNDFDKNEALDAYVGQFYLGVEYNVSPGQILMGAQESSHFRFTPKYNLFEARRPHSGATFLDIDLDGSLEYLQVFWINRSRNINTFYPPEIFSVNNKNFGIDVNNNNTLKNGSPSWSSEICDINNDNIIDILIANTSGHENFILEESPMVRRIILGLAILNT